MIFQSLHQVVVYHKLKVTIKRRLEVDQTQNHHKRAPVKQWDNQGVQRFSYGTLK